MYANIKTYLKREIDLLFLHVLWFSDKVKCGIRTEIEHWVGVSEHTGRGADLRRNGTKASFTH